jgi:hypothetical protein
MSADRVRSSARAGQPGVGTLDAAGGPASWCRGTVRATRRVADLDARLDAVCAGAPRTPTLVRGPVLGRALDECLRRFDGVDVPAGPDDATGTGWDDRPRRRTDGAAADVRGPASPRRFRTHGSCRPAGSPLSRTRNRAARRPALSHHAVGAARRAPDRLRRTTRLRAPGSRSTGCALSRARRPRSGSTMRAVLPGVDRVRVSGPSDPSGGGRPARRRRARGDRRLRHPR